MIDEFLDAHRAIAPFQSSLSPHFWPGPLRLRLNAPVKGLAALRFAKGSDAWVRERTKSGQGVHEPGLVKALIALRGVLGPMGGRDVYDVGMLHGYVGLLMGRILSPRKVYGFEMNPEAAGLAVENARLNADLEVEVVHAGVAAESAACVPCLYHGFALAVRPDPAEAGRLGAAGYRAADIDLLTLDGFAAQRGCAPAVIKIDVEGSQMSILRGADATLRGHAPVLLIEADGPKASNSDGTKMADLCLHLIETYGYRIAAMNHRVWDAPAEHVTRAAIGGGGLRLERNQLLVCLPDS